MRNCGQCQHPHPVLTACSVARRLRESAERRAAENDAKPVTASVTEAPKNVTRAVTKRPKPVTKAVTTAGNVTLPVTTDPEVTAPVTVSALIVPAKAAELARLAAKADGANVCAWLEAAILAHSRQPLSAADRQRKHRAKAAHGS